MSQFSDVSAAWDFLVDHPVFQYKDMSWFTESLYISVVKVNPATEEIDENETLNTEIQIWIECGPWIPKEKIEEAELREFSPYGMRSHDIDLDCGAPTFEEAIVKLAELVASKYGTYETQVSS